MKLLPGRGDQERWKEEGLGAQFLNATDKLTQFSLKLSKKVYLIAKLQELQLFGQTRNMFCRKNTI